MHSPEGVTEIVRACICLVTALIVVKAVAFVWKTTGEWDDSEARQMVRSLSTIFGVLGALVLYLIFMVEFTDGILHVLSHVPPSSVKSITQISCPADWMSPEQCNDYMRLLGQDSQNSSVCMPPEEMP